MNHSLLGACAALTLVATGSAWAQSQLSISYVPGSLAESTISGGPWTLHQGGPGGHDASGIVPLATDPGPPYKKSGTPYVGICDAAGQRTRNPGTNLMQPYYFPFVRGTGEDGQLLVGLFDYRPRNEDEQAVMAYSHDGGRNWKFATAALGVNPYCPADSTDPDNLQVLVSGAPTPYGSDSKNAGDNGLGHPFAAAIGGHTYVYSLNRANNHIDADQLVVHALRGGDDREDEREDERHPAALRKLGYLSPFASAGYPTLTSPVLSTSGLVNPDAVLGNVTLPHHRHAFLYVSKVLSGDTGYPTTEQCPSTPKFALTNLINGKPRKANHDVTTLRVATTDDGLHFADIGAAKGINDSTTVALNGIRYVGSGGLIELADGRWGLFFSGGSCLDNDSDGFHFIGYAETVNPVRSAADLLNWHVVNGFDNPILSTDTVTDTAPAKPRPYPLNRPVVDVTGADALSAAQVAPFSPPKGGYGSNFFSGRAYGPQPIVTRRDRVTIVFAGYNTPQPSNNLGDYRTIGRFELIFPRHYLKTGDED